MTKIQSDYEKKRIERKLPIYTKKDFLQLEDELEQYMIEKDFTFNGETRSVRYVPLEGMTKWFASKGATNEKYEVRNIALFKECQDLMEQYNNWIKRKEFAIRMQDLHYEEMAGQVANNMTDF